VSPNTGDIENNTSETINCTDIYSVTQSLSHSVTQSLSHSVTHSLTQSFIVHLSHCQCLVSMRHG
jgi:hypothetical protein